ncbi:MAG: 50S ribosomal protein L10, partial [Candidatus Jacksonbacteria bacterium]
GNIGVAGSMNDEVGAARILVKAIKDKEMEGLEVKAGILEGRIIEFSQVKALAALPSRKDLIAKIAGSINAPLSGLVNVLQGNQRKLIYVLSNIRGTK